MSSAFDSLYGVLFAAQGMPAPTAVAEADGEIALDWGIGSHCLSVSFRRDGRIGWAALIDDWAQHGNSVEIDDALLDAMKRWKAALKVQFT